MAKPREDLTGKQFGRLTVLDLHHIDEFHAGYWLCKCECGKKKQVRDNKLTTGLVVSCGCWRADPAVRSAARYVLPAKRRRQIAALGGEATRKNRAG